MNGTPTCHGTQLARSGSWVKRFSLVAREVGPRNARPGLPRRLADIRDGLPASLRHRSALLVIPEPGALVAVIHATRSVHPGNAGCRGSAPRNGLRTRRSFASYRALTRAGCHWGATVSVVLHRRVRQCSMRVRVHQQLTALSVLPCQSLRHLVQGSRFWLEKVLRAGTTHRRGAVNPMGLEPASVRRQQAPRSKRDLQYTRLPMCGHALSAACARCSRSQTCGRVNASPWLPSPAWPVGRGPQRCRRRAAGL